MSPALGAVVGAQPEYRNIDGGRPVRIDDADASARHSLDFQIVPARVDLITGGLYRYSGAFRAEAPKFNGLISAYHWMQVAVYEALLNGATPASARRS